MKLENQEPKEKEVLAKKQTKVKPQAELTLEESIAEWKTKFGKVYKNTVDDEVIIWRAIRRGEYRELLNISEELESSQRLLAKQEATVKFAVLYPSNINDLIEEKAGLATTLSEEILAKSGFDISETEAL